MIQFLTKRFIQIFPAFIGITLLTFSLVHLIPGDPVELMAGERGINTERHAQMKVAMGLDKPLPVQYLQYITKVFKGDLGKSFVTKKPVLKEFMTLFPATLELSLCAMIVAVLFGLPAGIIAGVKRGTVFDHSVMGISLAGYSMPIF
ncbi:MAG: peptide ABC transporter permease, partial [Desulfamplus sp.]|nr:peptide ABC transporter permease [Desulfamplus sp.]